MLLDGVESDLKSIGSDILGTLSDRDGIDAKFLTFERQKCDGMRRMGAGWDKMRF